MRVLVTGANGFLGQKIVAALLEAKQTVIACVRDEENIERRFPDVEIISCDFNRDISYDVWLPRLKGIEVVINCVGILQERQGQSIQAVHTLAPIALFKACFTGGVKRVIQISAYEAEENAATDYGRSKYSADKFLKSLDLDWVILKPSLVYSNGSYGGTSLFRAMAGLPFFIPLPEGGDQKMQPLFLGDFTKAVAKIVVSEKQQCREFNIVGPEEFSLKDIILQLRNWLGFGNVKIFSVPLVFMTIFAAIADFCSNGPFCSNSLKMLTTTKPTHDIDFWTHCDYKPLLMREALQVNPSNVQDRWHSRLYFLSPLLRISIGAYWFFSAVICLSQMTWSTKYMGLFAIWDLVLAGLMISKKNLSLTGSLQIITVVLGLILSGLFNVNSLELKDVFLQIILILATLVMMATSNER